MTIEKFEAIRAKGKTAAKPAAAKTAPAPAKPPKKTPAAPEGPPAVRVLADIVEKPIKWLWRGRVPLAMLSIIDGNPGLGKSGLAFDLAARLTTGRQMPLCADPAHPPAGVLILDSENNASEMIRPRLRVAGADLSRIFLPPEDEILAVPHCADWIERVVAAHGVKLVIIDPIMSFLHEGIDANSDQSVRAALNPLKAMCERTGAALLMVRHLNKKEGQSAIHRGGGSIAFAGVSRCALSVGVDPNDTDTCVVSGYKTNAGRLPPSITYTVGEKDAGGEIGMMPVIQWGVVRADLSADDIINRKTETLGGGATLAAAKAFLRRELSPGETPAKGVQERAQAEGISDSTLNRAKKELEVVTRTNGFAGPKLWSLPPPPNGGQSLERASSWQPLEKTPCLPMIVTPTDADASRPAKLPPEAPPGAADLPFGEPERGAA